MSKCICNIENTSGDYLFVHHGVGSNLQMPKYIFNGISTVVFVWKSPVQNTIHNKCLNLSFVKKNITFKHSIVAHM